MDHSAFNVFTKTLDKRREVWYKGERRGLVKGFDWAARSDGRRTETKAPFELVKTREHYPPSPPKKGQKMVSTSIGRRRKRLRIHAAVTELRTRHVCAICGSEDQRTFHHIRPKKFTISKTSNTAFKPVRDELLKCCVLCATCHTKVHQGYFSDVELQPFSEDDVDSIFNKYNQHTVNNAIK